jgi:hypothetical protein
MVRSMIKKIKDWWFCVKWRHQMRKDKREGRWPI